MALRLQPRSLRQKLLAAILLASVCSALACGLSLIVFGAHPFVIVACAVMFAVLASLAVWAWLHRPVTRALAELTEAARRVSHDRNYSLRVSPGPDRETRELGVAFNALLETMGQHTATLEATRHKLEREVEEHAGTEHALRDSEKRHRTLVAALTSVVWIADHAGEFTAEQPSWATYTGQSEEEYRGTGWHMAFHPEDRPVFERLWNRAAHARQALDCEARLLHALSGRHRLVSLRALPVLDSNGDVHEWVGTVTDIDDRRRAEDEIHRLNAGLEKRVQERTAQLVEANRELEAFSFSVSHDLRAPLRAIDGFSEALLEDFGARVDEEMREFITRIRGATLRMGQLIEDLLNLARISRTELQTQAVDLSAMAHQIVRALSHDEPQRRVECTVREGVLVQGDARLLRVALENLLGNAWKFTARADQPRIEFGMMREGERTVLFVRDNGAGFDMAHVGKLFGPFQRLHAAIDFPGTGIGLATVQRIIQRHRGRIWADAAPGAGATFYFTLGETDAGAANEPQHDTREMQWPRK
jgi:PAS domain S-box-containing protein